MSFSKLALSDIIFLILHIQLSMISHSRLFLNINFFRNKLRGNVALVRARVRMPPVGLGPGQ